MLMVVVWNINEFVIMEHKTGNIVLGVGLWKCGGGWGEVYGRGQED